MVGQTSLILSHTDFYHWVSWLSDSAAPQWTWWEPKNEKINNTTTHQHNCKTLYFHFFKKNIQLNLCPSKVQHQSNKYSRTSTKCNFRKDGNHYISSATAIGTLQVNEVSTTRYCKCFVKKWRISVHWNARGLLMWNGYRNCGFVVQS